MNKNKIELNLIKGMVKGHIKTLKKEKIERLDKEIDYLLIKEAIESLINEYYKLSGDSRQRPYIKEILIEVYEELCTYLINTNKYDNKILELYAMLDDIIYN